MELRLIKLDLVAAASAKVTVTWNAFRTKGGCKGGEGGAKGSREKAGRAAGGKGPCKAEDTAETSASVKYDHEEKKPRRVRNSEWCKHGRDCKSDTYEFYHGPCRNGSHCRDKRT